MGAGGYCQHTLPNGKPDGTQRALTLKFVPEYSQYRFSQDVLIENSVQQQGRLVDAGGLGFECSTVMHIDDFRSPVLYAIHAKRLITTAAFKLCRTICQVHGHVCPSTRAAWLTLCEHYVGKATSYKLKDLPETIDEIRDLTEFIQLPEAKARRLLQEVLVEDDLTHYEDKGWLELQGKFLPKRIDGENPVYRIFSDPSRVIDVLVNGKICARLCIEFESSYLPPTDAVVMKILLAKAAEERLWSVSNIFN